MLFDLAAQGVSGEDRAEVMRHYNFARRWILFYTCIKFGFWLQNPWLLFGSAHPNETTARRCAVLALQQFNNAATDHVFHFLELLLCVPGTPVADEFIAFASGAVRSGLRHLMRILGRFAFALTSERWVESLHAIARHNLVGAAHAGPVHLGFMTILRQMQKYLFLKPQAISALAATCSRNRNIMTALKDKGCDSSCDWHASKVSSFDHRLLSGRPAPRNPRPLSKIIIII